jgi:hypothetical protein
MATCLADRCTTNLCMNIGTYDVAKWNFDMIHRDEYERVCKENRELKEKIEQLLNRLGDTRDNYDPKRTQTVGVGYGPD